MTLWKLILDSLRYHWRTSAAVALAVAATTAVVTGALLVGDSMRGSLRHILLDQLGNIDEVLVTSRFFRGELARELENSEPFRQLFSQATPVIAVEGTIESPSAGGKRRAGGVNVIGGDARFWALGSGGPETAPRKNEVVLNAPLAAEVGAQVGSEVLLRIGNRSQIPPDSALGRKIDTVRTRRLKVTAIIAAEGLGRFALRPNQQIPLDAFVAPQTLQEMLEQPEKYNAIFVAGIPGRAPSEAAHQILKELLQPSLVDYGVSVEKNSRGYYQVTSDRMLLEPAVASAALGAYSAYKPQETFTYLANTIAGNGREIPYSTITAIDFAVAPPLGPFLTADGNSIGPLAQDEIVLNTWAANDLGVKPGDQIEIDYFEPESTHGQVRERKASFRLKAIVAMDGAAGDPDLTPRMPGVTDQLSIGDWDAPFPFDGSRVRKEDEDYWDDYRTTPKAFISLAAGKQLWKSRFGEATAVRFAPPDDISASDLSDHLRLDPVTLGFQFMPVKQMGLAAASGTTPFDGLFLAFSVFLMVASLLLVALLFLLGVEQRASEIGILRTVGIGQRRLRAALLGEALVVTTLGALAGSLLGVGYAKLLIAGLSTWWRGAISTPFLSLYVSPWSLVTGVMAGIVVSLLAVAWALRRMRGTPVRMLLSGQTQSVGTLDKSGSAKSRIAAWVALAAAIGTAFMAMQLGDAARAGAFFAAGGLVLVAGLTAIWARLRQGATASIASSGSLPLVRLAARSGARNPSRSTLSVGLIAAASFLIVALSAFRLDPGDSRARDGGTGGFTLVAQADQPIYQDLNTTTGRSDLGFTRTVEGVAAAIDVVPLRVRAGDDASCLNLYQPTDPRILGVTAGLIERGGFAWAASAADTSETRANPWLLLETQLPSDPSGTPRVPAVVDFNTATYSLHKALGDAIELTDEYGNEVQLVLVGLLKNSIFQGDVLVSEQDLLRHFPSVSGYRFFLVDAREQSPQKALGVLEDSLSDYGFDAEATSERLAKFFVVQNTYLSTFQSLGGLGLLLGTFGLATVQLRSVLERRGELALLRVAGFRRTRLAWLVMIENALLLLAGLAVGVGAALVAVLPYWLGGGAAVPWLSLVATLSLVLLVGLLAGLAAVRNTLRAELIPALREG